MEKMIQPQEEFAPTFDREAVAVEAAETARKMISERIDTTLQPEERVVAMVDLMQELAEDNGNRFIVEALAQQVSYEKMKQEIQTFAALYPHAVATNDEQFEYQEAA